MAKNNKTISNLIANQITYNRKDRLEIFREQEPHLQTAVFERLSPYVQQTILENLSDDEAVPLLDSLDLQKAKTALAQLSDDKRRNRIIYRLKAELKEKAQYFLRFHSKASLDLINFNYLLLSADTTVDETANAMEAYYSETKKFPEVLVHQDGVLVGQVEYSKLIRSPNRSKLTKLIVPIETIVYHSETNESLEMLTRHSNDKVVILDKDDSVIGILYTEDIQTLLKKQPAASLYEFAGVAENERPFDDVRKKVKHRYKWLIVNLGTAFMAAGVVSFYHDTLEMLVVLTMYLPVIAGMGGNAAAQTLAVMVRGISVGEITFSNCWQPLKKEIATGVINGLINGVIVFIIAVLWGQGWQIGIVLFLAMITSLIISAIAGTMIPLVMKRLGKDPAASATIFISTATDVFGFMSFLTIATWVLM